MKEKERREHEMKFCVICEVIPIKYAIFTISDD